MLGFLNFKYVFAYEKLGDLYFLFFSVRFFVVELVPFSGILANENLISKIFKQPLQLGS